MENDIKECAVPILDAVLKDSLWHVYTEMKKIKKWFFSMTAKYNKIHLHDKLLYKAIQPSCKMRLPHGEAFLK